MRFLVIDQLASNLKYVVGRLKELFPDTEIVATTSECEGLDTGEQDGRFDAILIGDYSNISGMLSDGISIANSLYVRRRRTPKTSETTFVVMTPGRLGNVLQRLFHRDVLVCEHFRAPVELYRLLKRNAREREVLRQKDE